MEHTYATLVTAITDWTEDPSNELQTHMDELIALASSRLVKDIDLEIFNSTDTGLFVVGNQEITKPTDAISLKTLTYTVGGKINYLYQRTDEYLDQYWSNSSLRADPLYFSELNETSWRVVPTPARNYAWKARYVKRPAELTSSNTSTFLSKNAGEALLYACLLETEAFIKSSPEDITIWAELYKGALIASSHEMMSLKNIDYREIEE